MNKAFFRERHLCSCENLAGDTLIPAPSFFPCSTHLQGCRPTWQHLSEVRGCLADTGVGEVLAGEAAAGGVCRSLD